MVHGKAGMKLEAFKFGLYLIVPITASLTFNDPRVQQAAADYFQFMKFPANPSTNLREEFEELVKKRQLEKEQRKLYAEQMHKLQESARESRLQAAASGSGSENGGVEKRGWFSWLRFSRRNVAKAGADE